MDSVERSQLLQVLHSRRDFIADSWHNAIAQTSFVPHSAAEVRQRLVELTENAIALLLTEPFEHDEAQTIGASLAGLHCVEAEALGRTQEVLAEQLVEGLPADQVVALQPRLAALLSGAAAGFIKQAREMTLAEQERVRGVVVAELRAMGEALRKSHHELEQRVAERTADLAAANEQLKQEIAERVRAQESLRESEGRLREIVENMPVLFDAFDENGVALFWNKECERVTGYGADEIVGNPKSMELLVPDPEYRAWILDQLHTLGHDYRAWELEVRCKNGETRTIAWSNISRRHPIPGWWSWGTGIDITERKQAEKQLRLLSSAVEQSSEGIATSDLEGNLTFVNHAFAASHGYAPEDLVGKPLSLFHTPEQMPSVEAANRQIQETGEFSGEIWHVRRDGAVFPTLMHNALLRDEAGNPIGMIGTLRDITELKRVEERLAYQAHLLANVNDAILATDDRFIVTAWNRAAEEIHGWKAEEAIGRVVQEVAPSDFTDAQRAEALRTLAEDGSYRVEVGMYRKDGQKIYVEGTTVALRGEDGRITGYVSVNRDITERKRAEEELRFKANVIDSALDSIFVVDLKGDVLFVNRTAAITRGYTQEEMIGMNLDKIDAPEYLPLLQPRRKILLEKGSHKYDSIHICKDGSQMSVNIYGQVVNWYGQRAILGIVRDITERKQAEEALKEYSERLEEMVDERAQQLRDAQRQLVRREKLAVLGQLAGGVSHELRGPLGAISNAAYFLNMVLEEPDSDVKEMLEIIIKEVKRSTRVIRSLLDFARTETPVWQKVDVNAVVQEALARTAVPANVEAATQLDDALPTIQADPVQLDRVFGNLILNAVQAMPEGGRLVVRTWEDETVCVSISDTGVGIPEEHLAKLFEPLFTTRAKGIGLGLALVKTLVEGHAGSIEVQSEVGKGSTFTVGLPIGRREEM